MNRQRQIVLFVTGVACLLSGGCSSLTDRIPNELAGSDQVELAFDPQPAEVLGYDTFAVRLANPTNLSVLFAGYSESSPWYRIQRQIDGEWVEHRVGWFCGTGMRACEIPTSRSSLIGVQIDKDLLPVRVGVEYSATAVGLYDQVVWSAAITADMVNSQ